jgi:hypothetical protein
MLESFRPDIKFIAKTASAILAVGVVFAFIFGAVSGNQQLIQAGNTMLTGIVVLAVHKT